MAPKKPRKAARIVLKADLHMHTANSGDSDISSRDIIRYAKAKGIDVVGVTDHNTTKGALETRELAKKEHPNLLVLVGQEVRTSEGEIIVFGIEANLQKMRPIAETCKHAKELGGFIVVPHPFDRMRRGLCKHIRDALPFIDAVEALNSKSLWKHLNRRARLFAEAHSIPVVAGSDAHIPQYIGSCYTLIDVGNAKVSMNTSGGKRSAEKRVYAAIRAGRTVCSGNVVGLRGAGMRARMKKLLKPRRRKHGVTSRRRTR